MDLALAAWRDMNSDADAHFDREVTLDAVEIAPMVLGTSPQDVVQVTGNVRTGARNG